MKFQDDISNMNTYIHTDKPKPICPPLFQSWGPNESLCMFSLFICTTQTLGIKGAVYRNFDFGAQKPEVHLMDLIFVT